MYYIPTQFVPQRLVQGVGSLPHHLLATIQPGLEAPQPSTSSAASTSSAQPDDDLVSTFSHRQKTWSSETLTLRVSRRKREWSGLTGRSSYFPPSQPLLVEVTSKPLKNTRHWQFLEHFPLPAECNHACPPKLDESISLIIPDSSRKEDRLLSRLQQFTMDSLGALLYLQEQRQNKLLRKTSR